MGIDQRYFLLYYQTAGERQHKQAYSLNPIWAGGGGGQNGQKTERFL